ncbi:MAG: glycosyltransferase family 39 protein [Candidatus Aminicenantes bacterium]
MGSKKRQAFLWSVVTFSLIIAGICLRLYRLTSRSLWLDEAASVKTAAMNSISGMIQVVVNDLHPPLSYILLRFWIFLFGSSDLSVRLSSVFWGGMGMLGIYFLCRAGLGWNQKTSNLATLFAVFIPIHAYYSQDVRHYVIWFAFACFALGFLFKAHSTMKLRYFLLFGLFQALLFYIHNGAILYCFIINILYLLFLMLYGKANGLRLRGILLSGFTSFILYLPWLPTLIRQLRNPTLFKGFPYWVPRPTPGDFLITLRKIVGVWDLNLPHHVPGALYLILLIPILVLLFGGLWFALKNQRVGESVLAAALAAYPLFIYFLSHLVVPIWLMRVLVPAAIGVPVAAASGAKKSLLGKKFPALLTVFIIFYVSVNLFASLNLLHTYQKQDWRGGAEFLSNSVQKEDAVLVYRHFYSTPLERYLPPRIEIKEVEITRESPGEDLSRKLAGKVVDLSGDAENTYLVFASSEVPLKKLLSVMDRTHELKQKKSFYGFAILIFQASPRI